MSFCAQQLTRLRPLWTRMVGHPFLVETRDGTISDDRFGVWMRQDYLFVEAAIPFIAALVTKAPADHRNSLAAVIGALQRELELFRDRAEAVGVNMDDLTPSFTTHAYIQFLMATGAYASYSEAYTVLYAAEKAYLDSWSAVRMGLPRDSKWFPFVENWSGEAFQQYVAALEHTLDGLAEAVGAAERTSMSRFFELTTRYEIAFWEMALTGAGWPGVPEAAP